MHPSQMYDVQNKKDIEKYILLFFYITTHKLNIKKITSSAKDTLFLIQTYTVFKTFV